jgi:hypothetical protein
MNAIFSRLREPSTWAGFGVLASIVGVPVTTFQLVQQVAMGIVGMIAVFAPEKAA